MLPPGITDIAFVDSAHCCPDDAINLEGVRVNSSIGSLSLTHPNDGGSMGAFEGSTHAANVSLLLFLFELPGSNELAL